MNVKRQFTMVAETLCSRSSLSTHEAESCDVTIIFIYKPATTPRLNDLIILIYNALYVRLLNY